MKVSVGSFKFLAMCSILNSVVGVDDATAAQEIGEWQKCHTFSAPSQLGGWGVYAARPYKSGEVVELELMTIPMPTGPSNETILLDYVMFYHDYASVKVCMMMYGPKSFQIWTQLSMWYSSRNNVLYLLVWQPAFLQSPATTESAICSFWCRA